MLLACCLPLPGVQGCAGDGLVRQLSKIVDHQITEACRLFVGYRRHRDFMNHYTYTPFWVDMLGTDKMPTVFEICHSTAFGHVFFAICSADSPSGNEAAFQAPIFNIKFLINF